MPDTTAVADELRDLRVLMNGLRMRLTSSEKELATLSSQGDIASRFDDISFRLASLERASIAFAAAPAPPVPGDGRFRVEMRGLDQRMEQLEAAARENRDAVLMQFERLASRLQWRLQQLELESTDAGYSTKASSTKASSPPSARRPDQERRLGPRTCADEAARRLLHMAARVARPGPPRLPHARRGTRSTERQKR